MKAYDLIIIGSGPAGLTASIYASRYKLSNLVIGKVLGGMMTYAHKVENYPGFVSISGVQLGQKMGEQVKALGAEIRAENVGRIEKEDGGFKVFTESNQEFEAKTLVVATGTERRKLNIPGEEEYLGKGVSYCTNCDAPFFKDKVVVVIGGADSAVSGAIHAAEFAKKVYIVYRRDKLRAEPVWVEEALANPKIEVVYNTNITEVMGDGNVVTGVKLDTPHQGSGQLEVGGVFIEIGGVPINSLLKPLGVEIDENGYIKAGQDLSTNIKGIFTAGDVADRCGEFQQITVACSEGSLAVASVFKYLKGQQAPKITGVVKQGAKKS
jgi:thioredoxin reductase (NADPH)